jgi:hypothetical protein
MDMDAPLLEIRKQLILPNHLRNDPLLVFVIAGCRKFRDEATLAMKQSVYYALLVLYESASSTLISRVRRVISQASDRL